MKRKLGDELSGLSFYARNRQIRMLAVVHIIIVWLGQVCDKRRAGTYFASANYAIGSLIILYFICHYPALTTLIALVLNKSIVTE